METSICLCPRPFRILYAQQKKMSASNFGDKDQYMRAKPWLSSSDFFFVSFLFLLRERQIGLKEYQRPASNKYRVVCHRGNGADKEVQILLATFTTLLNANKCCVKKIRCICQREVRMLEVKERH